MKVTHKYNGKVYILTNENLQNGDKVYPISSGKSNSKKFTYEHWGFDWRNFMCGWISEPHTLLDIHYSNYKPYEVHTDHGFGPVEHYFKIIQCSQVINGVEVITYYAKGSKIVKPQPPTGTAEALAFAYEYEMNKKDKKPVKFIYYNEKKIK
jgi:hypothetical protein